MLLELQNLLLQEHLFFKKVYTFNSILDAGNNTQLLGGFLYFYRSFFCLSIGTHAQ